SVATSVSKEYSHLITSARSNGGTAVVGQCRFASYVFVQVVRGVHVKAVDVTDETSTSTDTSLNDTLPHRVAADVNDVAGDVQREFYRRINDSNQVNHRNFSFLQSLLSVSEVSQSQ